MERTSRLRFVGYATSILFPYGIITTDTMIMTTNQYWLFPLWVYVHDFVNWLEFGIIIPPFLPTFSNLPSIVGLIWCLVGIYIAFNLDQVYRGKREASSIRLRIMYFLILQLIVTTIISYVVWGNWIIFVLPVPLHCLTLLALLHMYKENEQDLF